MFKRILKVFCTILVLMLVITNVSAKELIKTGDAVTQEGNYDSTRFAFGKTINDKSYIDGLSFIAGESLTLEGEASYGFYAGRNLLIAGSITKDAFMAGDSIYLKENSIIGRDVFIACNTIKISSLIKRDLRLEASTVDLSGATINGDAIISAESIKFDDSTKILGKLSYSKDTKIEGLTDTTAGSVEITKAKETEQSSNSKNIIEKAKKTIITIIRAFIVMIVLLWLLPKLKDKLKDEELNTATIAKKSLIGFAVLILIPILAIIALFIGVLSALSIITIPIYFICLYLATLFVYYIVGNYLDKKLIKKDNTYLSLICGICVVELITMIPVIGGIVSFIILVYGVGIIFNYINSIRKEN